MNSVGFVAISVILCATICTGKNMYDDIDVHGSEGKSINILLLRSFYCNLFGCCMQIMNKCY